MGRSWGQEDKLGWAQGRRVPIRAGRFRAPAQARSTMSIGLALSEPTCHKGLPSLTPQTPLSAPEHPSSQPRAQGDLPRLVTEGSNGTTSHPDVPEDALGKCDPAQAASAAHGPLGRDRPPVPAGWLLTPAEPPLVNREGLRGERGFSKQPGCSFALPQHLGAPCPCSPFPLAGRGAACLSVLLCWCPQS